jgi:uncharacterized metal-binding protein YceD (DUF177 family)
MTDGLPLAHAYNLARLGNAGDVVTFAADETQRAAIARWAGILSLERLDTGIEIKKLGPVRFGLDFTLSAELTQACVVTLDPVPARIEHRFHRELLFTGPARHKPDPESVGDVVLDSLEDEGPEEISSLHYDLATPVLEELVLSLEPYPRRPGVAFAPPSDGLEAPESPFAVLKSLK